MISGIVVWASWPVVAGLVALWRVRRRDSPLEVLGAIVLSTYALWICSVAFFPMPLHSAGAEGEGLSGSSVNLVPIRDLVSTLPTLSAGQLIREFGGNLLLLVRIHAVRAHVVGASARVALGFGYRAWSFCHHRAYAVGSIRGSRLRV